MLTVWTIRDHRYWTTRTRSYAMMIMGGFLVIFWLWYVGHGVPRVGRPNSEYRHVDSLLDMKDAMAVLADGQLSIN